MGLKEETQEALLELMGRSAITFSDKVCLRIAQCLVDKGLSPEKSNVLQAIL